MSIKTYLQTLLTAFSKQTVCDSFPSSTKILWAFAGDGTSNTYTAPYDGWFVVGSVNLYSCGAYGNVGECHVDASTNGYLRFYIPLRKGQTVVYSGFTTDREASTAYFVSALNQV
jgi:hypothetical protein